MKDKGREMTVVDCKKLTFVDCKKSVDYKKSEHCFPHIFPPPYFNHRDTFLCRGLSSDLQMSNCKLGQLNISELGRLRNTNSQDDSVRARQTFLYVL